MGVALGWVAFILAGVAAPPAAEPGQAQITYKVRLLETEGVGWREGIFARLNPVARQGNATIWTCPQDAITELVARIAENRTATDLHAPRVTASSGSPAVIQCRNNRDVVTQVAWKTGPQHTESKSEGIRTGWHTTMVGRKLDQGVLVKMVLEDTEIRAIHRVQLDRVTETAGNSTGAVCAKTGAPQNCAGTAATVVGRPPIAAAQEVACMNETCDRDDARCPITFEDVKKMTVEVPEINTQEVLGEWLIPNGEVLLVSLGAYTIADTEGKAVVKERLAVFEAAEASAWAPAHRPMSAVSAAHMNSLDATVNEGAASSDVPFLPPASAMSATAARPAEPGAPAAFPDAPAPFVPAPPVPGRIPKVPDRAIPQGIHADGRLAELPPLPADETADDSSESDSAEPRPSPQTKKPQPQPPAPATDEKTTKTALSQTKSSTVFLPSLFLPTPGMGLQFLLPLKPLSLRLPFNQRLEIEIYGRIVPQSQ